MEKQDRLQILNMCHDEVMELSDTIVGCIDGDTITIETFDGYELLKTPKSELRLIGSFALSTSIKPDMIAITNFKTLKTKNIRVNNPRIEIENSELLSNDIICVGNKWDGTHIINSYLDEIAEFSRLSYIKRTNNASDGFFIIYKFYDEYYQESGMYHTAFISNTTQNFRFYDTREFNVNSGIIATTLKANSKRGVSINRYSLDILRYKLTYNNRIVSEKDYEDILEARSIGCENDTFLTIDIESDRKQYKELFENLNNNKIDINVLGNVALTGIIKADGREVIPPIADSIDYLKNDNYIVTCTYDNKKVLSTYSGRSEYKKEQYRFIYNDILKKVIAGPYSVDRIQIHETLPIVTISNLDGTYEILDIYNRRFNVYDIAKYFECYYSKNNPSIIKVNLEYATKYITNNLVPITNLNLLKDIINDEWISMSSM